MNSNRLHKIFGSRSGLSRKDITDYGNTKDAATRHSIEEKAASGSFESDALEGWDALNHDMTVMNKADKRFMPRPRTGLYIIGSVAAVGIIATVVVLVMNQGTNETTTAAPEEQKVVTELMEDQQITLEQSDIVLPEPIEKMQPASEEKQVKVAQIKEDFKEMQTTYEPEDPIVVEMLPVGDLQFDPIEPQIIRDHKHAREIYLHDLKLVDYTKYRSKPQIRTKQILLTGTPANMEGQESEETEPVTREVDIPYIEYLDKTMSRFSRGSYKNALSRFEIILDTYNSDVNANFYSGLCLYNLGEYEKAITAFNKCIIGPYSNFDEEAQWMTAQCYEKSGNPSKAQEYYKKIVKQGGFYKKQAAAKIK